MRPTELIDLLVKAQMLVEESAGVFGWKPTMEKTEIFAKLVAAKEREANIKIIKETPFSNWFQADVIEAIRARGEQA